MITYNFPQLLKVFIGYAHSSDFYNKEQFVHEINNCCTKAYDNLKSKPEMQNTSIKLESHDFHLKVGEIINLSIRNQIRNSDICIFEISENNPNVFYEAGFALGLSKTVIYVSHASMVRNIASDNSGVGIATYMDLNDLNNNLVVEIEKAITHIINSKSVVDSFWEFTQNPTTAFLGKDKSNFSIGDLKALELIRAKIKNHRNIEIGIEQKFENQLSTNLIIIGGPKSNEYIRKIYTICNQLKYDIQEIETCETKNKWCIIKDGNVCCNTNFTHEQTTDSAEKDYAIVYLSRNPYQSNIKWFCFSGLTRMSTIESIRCFLDEKNISKLLELLDYNPDYDYSLILEIGIFNGISFGFKLIEFEKITPAKNA